MKPLDKYFPLVAHTAHITNKAAREHAPRFMDTVLWGLFKYRTSPDHKSYFYIDTAVKVAFTDDFCAGVQAYSPHVSKYTPCPFGGQFAHSAHRNRVPIEHDSVDSEGSLFTACVPDLGIMFDDDGEYGYHSHEEVEAWGYRNLMMSVIGYAHADSRCIITMNDVVNSEEHDYSDTDTCRLVGAVDYLVHSAHEGVRGMKEALKAGCSSPYGMSGNREDGWQMRSYRHLSPVVDVDLASTPPVLNRNSGNEVSVHSLMLSSESVDDGEEFYCDECEEQSVAYDGRCEYCGSEPCTEYVEPPSAAKRYYDSKVRSPSYRLLTRTGGWTNG